MDRVSEIGDRLRRLGAVIGERRELIESLSGIAGKNGLKQIEDAAAIGKPEQPTHGLSLDLARAEGDGAVKDRKRIAHRAFGGACDQHQRREIGRGIFLRYDAGKMPGELLDLDALEVKALTARQDSDRNLACFSRGEYELHMLGRLFQSFEEAVEGLLRQHVHLVDDVDLVPRGLLR